MDSMNLIVEVGTNLFQAFMFVGFVFFFFERNFTRVKNIICYLSAVAVMFGALNWFLFNSPPFNYSDALIYIAIMCIYSIISLKGKTILKVSICVLDYLINAVLSYMVGFLVCALTGVTLYDIAMGPSIGRYMCIILANGTTWIAYMIIIRLKRKSLSIIRKSDLLSIIIVPVLSLVIIYSSVYVLIVSGYMESLLPFLLAIDISMIAVTVIIWLIMSRISRDNEERTRLLLAEQHMEMYKKNTIQMNEQIEKVSRIRHDMNDNIRCIKNLLNARNYSDAEEYCDRVTTHFNAAYTPIATDNPLLNAILNVQLERAAEAGLTLITKISDDMSEFSEFSDIVPAIGNLCRNAIDYLMNNETIDRRIVLSARKDGDFYVISCTNAVNGSVLDKNPQLETSKNDNVNHGHGISIIRAAARKHLGNLMYEEENGYITFTIYFE